MTTCSDLGKLRRCHVARGGRRFPLIVADGLACAEALQNRIAAFVNKALLIYALPFSHGTRFFYG